MHINPQLFRFTFISNHLCFWESSFIGTIRLTFKWHYVIVFHQEYHCEGNPAGNINGITVRESLTKEVTSMVLLRGNPRMLFFWKIFVYFHVFRLTIFFSYRTTFQFSTLHVLSLANHTYDKYHKLVYATLASGEYECFSVLLSNVYLCLTFIYKC